MTTQEKKNDRIGMGISIGIHVALLILFIFLLAWKEPFPPLPEYGIEVNFGIDDAGSGDIQPTTPANVNPNPVEEEPAPEPPASAEETAPEPTTEEAVEEIPEPQQEEIQEVKTPEVEPEVTQPEPDVVPVKEEPKKQEPVEKPVEEKPAKLDPAAAYPNKKSNTSGADGVEGRSESADNSNQGDKPGETGDQGNPEGKVDARALYGNPGGGAGGAALEMSGWNWDFLPDKKDPGNAEGHIIFEIKIDEDGEILAIRTISKTVSETTVKFYRSEVAKLTFSPTSVNSKPAPTTTGRITFIIKSR